MKILLTVHQFLPEYASGTEILTQHTALEFTVRGHQVEIMAALPNQFGVPDAERFDSYEYQGIPVTRFKHAHCPMGGQDNLTELEYNNLLVAQRFASLIDRFRPDVVHFFHLMRLSASIIDVCEARSIPMVLTPTDFWMICPMCQLRLPDSTMCAGPDLWAANCVKHLASLKAPGAATTLLNALPNSAVWTMVRLAGGAAFRTSRTARMVTALAARRDFLARRVNKIGRVLTPTKLMQKTLAAQGVAPSRMQHCAYGIRLPERITRGRQQVASLRLGLIGLGEHKGAHILLQAMQELASYDLRVKIYGRASDFPAYFERLKDFADPRVEFCGTFPNEEIGSVLADLDILVVPSLWFENAPLVVYSAQAAGRPVIASDVPGLTEGITHGDNGWLSPAGDSDRLAALLAELASDPEQVARISGNARMPKSISTYVDELLAVYGELNAAETHLK